MSSGRTPPLTGTLIALRALDRPGNLRARGHAQLPEQVAHVGLHRLQADEQLGGDLLVRLPVHDEPRHLQLPLAQLAERLVRGGTPARPPLDHPAELAELALR